MQRAALGILLLLIHAAQQESGYSPYDDKEIEEPKAEFDCFSNLTVKVLFCNLTNHNARNSRNIALTACDKELVCHKMARKGNMYSLKRIHRTQTFNICMSIQSRQTCKEYYITNIVLVDPPIKVTVTHSKLEREYSITYEEPSHLRDKLQYQIALRKENEEWPDCDTLTDSKQCRMVQYTETQIPEADLEPATKYETKVRSKPNGDFYEGRWSAWSKPVKFESQATPEEKGGNILLRTLTAIGFLIILLVCILFSVFWKSRIKPIVWPEIPDHKTTLEQLCKQPRSDQQMSFNPDLFEDVHINKVDYLKAMPPTKGLFHEFPDEGVPPSDMRDSLLESNQISTACINSVPMRKDGEFSSWENNDAQCTQPLNDKSHDATKGCSLVISSMISTNTSPKPYDDYNLPDTISSLLPFSKIGNSQINAENNECTALCRDKAYITIAAFQMPGSAVKQTSLCYGQ